MNTAVYQVQERRTRIRLDGDPTNPPVVLLHGIGRSLEDWAPQFPRLSRHFRVISLDLPGSGFSQRVPRTTSLSVLADAVLATLDMLGEHRPVHVIGNSLGGAVAQQILAHAPESVASLVLVDSAGFGREVALPLRLLTLPVLGKFMATHATPSAAKMAERLSFADPKLATPARVEHALTIAQQPDTGNVVWETANALATFKGGIRPQWRAELIAHGVEEGKPTLIVWGDRDKLLPYHHLDAALRALPHATSHTFAGVGHMPQIESPDEFAAAVLDFLGARQTAHRRSQRSRASR